jgi:hypothetical protein
MRRRGCSPDPLQPCYLCNTVPTLQGDRGSGIQGVREVSLGVNIYSSVPFQSAERSPGQAGLCSKGLRPNVAVRASSSKTQVEDASATDAETTAMSVGSFSPEISDAFTVSPDMVYSPIVPVWKFVTNKFPPDTAMPFGPFRPEIRAASTIAPVVALYSPIVPVTESVTNRFPPEIAMSIGEISPETSAAFTITGARLSLGAV